MHPLVAVKSFGNEKVSEIIKEILKENGDLTLEPISMCIDSYEFVAYKLLIATRYYTTTVLLFECIDLNTIPEAVKNKIEGSIFYFDSNDKKFLAEVNALVKFVNDNHVEVSTLITKNLSENSLHGVSYDEIKNICQLSCSIIDLNSKHDSEEIVGYAEVLEVLKNHVWSNVNASSHNSSELPNLDENDENVEEALNEFEDLLTKFQQFKDISPNLCREQVLQYAENLADHFQNLLNED